MQARSRSVEVVLDGCARCDQRCEDVSDELLVDRVISVRHVVLDVREVCDDDVVGISWIDAGIGTVLISTDFGDRHRHGVQTVGDVSELLGRDSFDPTKHHHVSQHARTLVDGLTNGR
jgi:hypothetical protein